MEALRPWFVLSLAPFACAAILDACSSKSDLPPLLGGVIEAGTNGGNSQGGGGGSANNDCVTQGGVCTGAGNVIDGGGTSCPVQLFLSCGPGSVDDAGQAVLVCCGGYNDAGLPDTGPPDVVHDTSGQ